VASSRRSEPDDPTAGLPEDLAAVLRDQSIIVPQDQAVWELLASWRNAPCDTASADLTVLGHCPHGVDRSVLDASDRIIDGCIIAVAEYTTDELCEIAREADERSNGESWLGRMLREYIETWRQ
jgi:hypothetical protein